eukprot:gene18632-22244_t
MVSQMMLTTVSLHGGILIGLVSDAFCVTIGLLMLGTMTLLLSFLMRTVHQGLTQMPPLACDIKIPSRAVFSKHLSPLDRLQILWCLCYTETQTVWMSHLLEPGEDPDDEWRYVAPARLSLPRLSSEGSEERRDNSLAICKGLFAFVRSAVVRKVHRIRSQWDQEGNAKFLRRSYDPWMRVSITGFTSSLTDGGIWCGPWLGDLGSFGVFFEELRGVPVAIEEAVDQRRPSEHSSRSACVDPPTMPWRLHYVTLKSSIMMFLTAAVGFSVPLCACKEGELDEQPLMCTWPQPAALVLIFLAQ